MIVSDFGISVSILGGKFFFLTFFDYLYASFIVCPLVVGYWRSIWNLIGLYIYPENEWLSAFISFLTGVLGNLLFSVLQKVFRDNFHPKKNFILFYVVSRMHLLLLCFVCISSWRGPWIILDDHLNQNTVAAVVIVSVSIVALIALKTLGNVVASPFVVTPDKIEDIFDLSTMFRTPLNKVSVQYILDCLFSTIIVGNLVVFIWQGLWMLMDILIIPDDAVLSNLASLVIGYVGTAITFLMQPVAKYYCEVLTGRARLVVFEILQLSAIFATVNIWRAIWNLLDFYCLPDEPLLSNWLVHWVTFVALLLMGCANSIMTRGVFIDGEEPGGECAVFPIFYLRGLFLKETTSEKNEKSLEENFKTSIKNGKPLDTIVNISIIHKPSL